MDKWINEKVQLSDSMLAWICVNDEENEKWLVQIYAMYAQTNI